MRRRYRWICGLIAACVLSASLTGCGLSDFLEGAVGKTAAEAETGRAGAGTGQITDESAGKTASAGAAAGETGAAEPYTILPARFDYREQGRCPEAGSQGSLGTCWAFATMLALESSLLPEEEWDLSEDHISLHNSFGMRQDMGGDYTMAMAYLLAWQGPVRESDDPYGDGQSPDGLMPVKHVQEIQILGEKDYQDIKTAVYFHGGVQTSLYAAMNDKRNLSVFYREDTYAYYYNGSAAPNHDVVIVGWDDDYPRENFTSDPGRDGAFLCMNSWGKEFGDNGLFYVSYADTNLGLRSLVYTEVEEPDNFDVLYQSDLCGWLGQLGYGDGEAYFANVYEAKAGEQVEAVGFYGTGPNTEYEVFLIEDAGKNGELKLGKRAAAGRFDRAGFYTVRLDEPVDLRPGERFAAAVHIRTPGAVHPVAIEFGSGEGEITADVDLSDGEGYISSDGRLWSRTETEQASNVCLKVYTRRR